MRSRWRRDFGSGEDHNYGAVHEYGPVTSAALGFGHGEDHNYCSAPAGLVTFRCGVEPFGPARITT